MEVPPNAGWERPPGLGTCALETVFYLCHLIHNWLRSSEGHAVVRLKCCTSTATGSPACNQGCTVCGNNALQSFQYHC